jgi:hypothetical protein
MQLTREWKQFSNTQTTLLYFMVHLPVCLQGGRHRISFSSLYLETRLVHT